MTEALYLQAKLHTQAMNVEDHMKLRPVIIIYARSLSLSLSSYLHTHTLNTVLTTHVGHQFHKSQFSHKSSTLLEAFSRYVQW